MELILNEPIEKLVPLLISWNNEELLKEVSEKLSYYNALTYGENQISEAKTDRALLNKFCDSLNNERIRIGRLYTEPYNKFKMEVDEVIGMVKNTIKQIDLQVKTFEDKKQEEKLEEILVYFDNVVGDLKHFINYDKIHNPKWLNASTSIKNVKKDIDNTLEKIKSDINTIELLKSENETLIKAFYFRNLNLNEALAENELLKQEKQKIEIVEKVNIPQPKVSFTAENLKVIDFRVEATITQLKELKEFLITKNIKFSKIN